MEIDEGTIERECEVSKQDHKFSLNNAFVRMKFTTVEINLDVLVFILLYVSLSHSLVE